MCPLTSSMEIKKATSFFTPHSPVNFIFFILQLLWPCCKISLSRAACSSDPWTRKSWASAGSKSTAGRAGSAVPAPGQIPWDSLAGHQDSKTNPNAGVLTHTCHVLLLYWHVFITHTSTVTDLAWRHIQILFFPRGKDREVNWDKSIVGSLNIYRSPEWKS